nr:hypothetical protein CFP56_60134 [Quercus suber]
MNSSSSKLMAELKWAINLDGWVVEILEVTITESRVNPLLMAASARKPIMAFSGQWHVSKGGAIECMEDDSPTVHGTKEVRSLTHIQLLKGESAYHQDYTSV